MNAKHALSLMAALGVTALVVSALGQEQPRTAPPTVYRTAPGDPTLVPVPVTPTGPGGGMMPGMPGGYGGSTGYSSGSG
ncbi:MAG TPA: hypothetical protein VGY53_04600, partial [Isosphaeraceae bacterium]|nr:hypothetical protein [Isosphaeraceae bacterium]